MEVEGAVGRHVPHSLGKHAEGYDNKHVGLVGCQLLKKLWVAELLGLQQGQVMVESVLLDGTEDYFLSASSLPVGHGDDGTDLMAALHDSVEALNGKVGSSEIDDFHYLYWY